VRITKQVLNFLDEALHEFEHDETLTTYTDYDECYIALRTTGDLTRDSVLIHKIERIAEFNGVLKQGRKITIRNEEIE
jgi:hypothetical protein